MKEVFGHAGISDLLQQGFFGNFEWQHCVEVKLLPDINSTVNRCRSAYKLDNTS